MKQAIRRISFGIVVGLITLSGMAFASGTRITWQKGLPKGISFGSDRWDATLNINWIDDNNHISATPIPIQKGSYIEVEPFFHDSKGKKYTTTGFHSTSGITYKFTAYNPTTLNYTF